MNCYSHILSKEMRFLQPQWEPTKAQSEIRKKREGVLPKSATGLNDTPTPTGEAEALSTAGKNEKKGDMSGS